MRPPPRRNTNCDDDEQRKLSQRVTMLQRQLAAAQEMLKKSEKQKEELMAKLERASSGSDEASGGTAALREQISALRAQLQAQQTGIGTSSDPCSDWDGTLSAAREGMRAVMVRIEEGDDRPELIANFEKWEKRVCTHPDHLAAEQRKKEEWEQKERPKCAAALEFIRGVLPPHILQTTRAVLRQQEGMTEPLLKRLWEKRVLWLVCMHEQDVAKIHHADLKTKYSYQGCDITECRAVYAALPARFDGEGESEGGKVKQEWRVGLRDRLVQLSEQEDVGTLKPDDQTHPAYSTCAVMIPPRSAARVPPARPPPTPPPPPPPPALLRDDPLASTACPPLVVAGADELFAAIRARRVD
jgi:hypothetical protein